MGSLRVTTIHNGELDSSPALKVVTAVSQWTAAVDDVSEQAEWDPNPDVEDLERWRREQSLRERAWAEHLGTRVHPLRSTLGTMLYSLRLRTSDSTRANAWHIRHVEKAVTDKHVRAWTRFFESDQDELLILESDAAWTDEAATVIEALLEDSSERPRYVNLAGGLNSEDLGITRWEVGRWRGNDRLTVYSRPVTNTSCAYVMNRPMAQMALDYLATAPTAISLGIDWLVNDIFLANRESSIECLHALPPVLQHGSIVGLTQSWHPGR